LFGLRALNALRLEKHYGSWAREYRPLYDPIEAGLERFISYDKAADFIGKKAAIASRKNQGGPMRLCCFSLDARDADASGDEPISHQGRVVGWVTSGGFAHASGVSVAMGYVQRELADTLDDWQIEILGEQRQATLQRKPLFDPEGARMRG
jgi:dimethylglycine dehydrogenase